MGRTATGVRAITLADGDEVVSFRQAKDGDIVLTVSEHGYGKRTRLEEYPMHKRGGKGVRTMTVTEKTGNVTGITIVGEEDDVMLINSDGTIIRMAAEQISLYSRSAQGVRLMRLADDARVVSIATTPAEKDEEEAEETTEE